MSLSIQNRTFEFQQCVSTFDKINKKSNNNQYGNQYNNNQLIQQRNGGGHNNNNNSNNSKKSKFSQQASIIAKDISHTTELLSKLALLAKRKPLFDDKPIEIGELTYVIKQDIFKIENNLKNLSNFMKGDSTIQINSQINQNLKNILNLLNSKMKNISGEFKNVLEIRQKNEILNKSRTENFLSMASNNRNSNNNSNNSNNGNNSTSNNNNNNNNNHNNINNNNSIDNNSGNPYAYSFSNQNPDLDPDTSVPNYNNGEFLSIPDQTKQLLMMEDQSQEYLQQRNRAVETIESTINEVGNLFQQLATMVSEQGETIQRIDQNVEDINLNISGAQRELLKYYNNISSNRWLFLKIFGVLIIFFLIWVLVS